MLDGKRIAILVEAGFEDSELFEPMRAMKEAGARVVPIGANFATRYQSKNSKQSVTVEVTTGKIKADDFDAIIIPGVDARDDIQFHPAVIDLVKKIHDLGRVVAAICHGPRVLTLVDMVKGHHLASCPSLAIDLKNAGADWVDESVVKDGNIITSHKVADLLVFHWTIFDTLKANGRYSGNTVAFR